jgi:hypothetical protein
MEALEDPLKAKLISTVPHPHKTTGKIIVHNKRVRNSQS